MNIKNARYKIITQLNELKNAERLCVAFCAAALAVILVAVFSPYGVLGMTYDEIAQTLGVKMGTVRSRIHRARAQLRDMLERDVELGHLSYIGS